MFAQLQDFARRKPYLVGALVVFLVWFFFLRNKEGFSGGQTAVKGVYDEEKK